MMIEMEGEAVIFHHETAKHAEYGACTPKVEWCLVGEAGAQFEAYQKRQFANKYIYNNSVANQLMWPTIKTRDTAMPKLSFED